VRNLTEPAEDGGFRGKAEERRIEEGRGKASRKRYQRWAIAVVGLSDGGGGGSRGGALDVWSQYVTMWGRSEWA
jgi:hypothetical protein